MNLITRRDCGKADTRGRKRQRRVSRIADTLAIKRLLPDRGRKECDGNPFSCLHVLLRERDTPGKNSSDVGVLN